MMTLMSGLLLDQSDDGTDEWVAPRPKDQVMTLMNVSSLARPITVLVIFYCLTNQTMISLDVSLVDRLGHYRTDLGKCNHLYDETQGTNETQVLSTENCLLQVQENR